MKLTSIKSIAKSSILTLDSDQIQAASVHGKKITGVWKLNGDIPAIQLDGKEDKMYYWTQGVWESFTPIALTPTSALAE